MCGIVGAVAERNIVPILIEGLRRLEYRGYDSAGLAVLDDAQHLERVRTVGKVKMLQEALQAIDKRDCAAVRRAIERDLFAAGQLLRRSCAKGSLTAVPSVAA